MSDAPSVTRQIKFAELRPDERRAFTLTPDAADRAKVQAKLGLQGLRKLRFEGRIEPLGAADWQLVADLGATATQSCVVTLEPVSTRIEERVIRRYLSEPPDLPEGDEIEMPDDETVEPRPDVLDLVDVMTEALALALPAYPRAKGAALAETVVTEAGAAPLTEAAVKPFSGLAALRDKLSDERDS